MMRNKRISNKLRNIVIYLCNNNIFLMLYAIFLLGLAISSFLYNFNNKMRFLFFIVAEIGIIIETIKGNDKVKDNKLIYVILSRKYPVLYPLIMLSVNFSYVFIIIFYFINLSDIICIIVYIVILCILLLLQIYLTKEINKYFRCKLK